MVNNSIQRLNDREKKCVCMTQKTFVDSAQSFIYLPHTVIYEYDGGKRANMPVYFFALTKSEFKTLTKGIKIKAISNGLSV